MSRLTTGTVALTLLCAVVAGAQETADAAGAVAPVAADSVDVGGKRLAVAEITRDDIEDLTYDDLIAMSFEALVAIADKLNMSVDELLNMKLTVASKTSTTIREQPGILSVITREEILRSGARDLVDVLRAVPGLWFGMDVEGVMGMVMRGNWAHEGKVLVLVDGQMMNEVRFSSTPMEQHYPIENIKRIEIIRGPGSSMYGGFAELGVVNIVTLQGADVRGVAGSRSLGLMGKSGDDELVVTPAHNRTWFGCGAERGKLEFSLSGFYGDGHRSDEQYQSLYFEFDSADNVVYDDNGNPARYTGDFKEDYGQIANCNVNVAARYGGLSGRFIYDKYAESAFDAGAYWDYFTTWLGEVRYDWKLAGGELMLTPRYNFRLDVPWYSDGWYENVRTARHSGEVACVFEPGPYLTLNGGIGAEYDAIRMMDDPWDSSFSVPEAHEDTVLYNGKESASLVNGLGYLQGVLRAAKVGLTFTAGIRAEYHELYEGSLAPRFALTQVLKGFHYKLLYSRAFRSPNGGNIEYNPGIAPEKTDVFEVELGYRLNSHILLTANAFDITIRDPIVYSAASDVDAYVNGGRLGSTGGEAVLALRFPRVNGSLSYSYYSANRKPANDEDMGFVPEPADDELRTSRFDQPYFAAPQHKVAATATVNPWKKLFVTPSLVYASTVYATTDVEFVDGVDDTYVCEGLEPAWLLNLYVRYEDLLVDGLDVGLGVYDILDRDVEWAQAYDGTEAPFPGTGREVMLRMDYAFGRTRR